MNSILTSVSVFMMMTIAFTSHARSDSDAFIEVTGTSTVSIVPDRITIEIGMEEYHLNDSTIVCLADIEKGIRQTLRNAGIYDSDIVVSDIGNYRDRDKSSDFLMAKRLAATVSDFDIIDRISDRLDRRGISSFNITRIDNTEIERFNNQGLKAALDAAGRKAEFIADNEGLRLLQPYEITENGPDYYDTPTFSNVSVESGAGMENMRRIIRRYSVRVRYLFISE